MLKTFYVFKHIFIMQKLGNSFSKLLSKTIF